MVSQKWGNRGKRSNWPIANLSRKKRKILETQRRPWRGNKPADMLGRPAIASVKPVRDVSYLFDTPPFREHGPIFWPDYACWTLKPEFWQILAWSATAMASGPAGGSGHVVCRLQGLVHILAAQVDQPNAAAVERFAYDGADACDLPPFYGPGAVRVGSTVTDGSSGRFRCAAPSRGTIAAYSAGVRYPNEL